MSAIVGISAFYHDAACCLLRDGKLLHAVEEERLTRRKHDPRLPVESFKWCLREAGLTPADLDCIAYYEDPTQKLERQLWMGMRAEANDALRDKAVRRLAEHGFVEQEIRERFGFGGRIEIIPHHEAHAASAFYFSGFPEAALFTVDGVGEWTTTGYGTASGKDLSLFETVSFPHSLGLLYSTLTAYLGFEVNEGEYKVMGLAPYGEARYVDQLRQLVEVQAGGQYRLNLEFFDFLRGERMFSDRLVELLGQPPREPESDIAQFHQDVSKSLQVVLEEILIGKARYLHAKTGSDHLCMAGGVALNCVANGKILRDSPFHHMFVQPAASDAGGALGAAALAHVRVTGQVPAKERLASACVGPRYPADRVARLVRRTKIPALDFRGDETALVDEVAARLADGKVIGWMHGAMEFGPRALGGRSILADPRRPEMRDKINALVKMREAFRPFAPAVLWEHARTHFDIDHESPFMLETCQVISPLELPAITHVDGSARVQTVTPEASPRFARLLQRFHELTGCPILLNTSFNLRGEPIVCTPEEALLCLLRSRIEALVLDDYLIDRDAIPARLFDRVPPLSKGPRMVSRDVYTML